MTDLLQIPSFLMRQGDPKVKLTQTKRRRARRGKIKPPTHLGKAWSERLSRSSLVQMHFTNEHPQISGQHLMWAFVGRRWVYLCSSRGTIRFRLKRAVFEQIKIATVREAA